MNSSRTTVHKDVTSATTNNPSTKSKHHLLAKQKMAGGWGVKKKDTLLSTMLEVRKNPKLSKWLHKQFENRTEKQYYKPEC